MKRTQAEFPTVPGSLVRATACDDRRPAVYMLAAPDEPDEAPAWVRPDLLAEPYRQADLTLIEVLHDEGRASRPGQVAATVQVLTGAQAMQDVPELVADNDGEPYFNELLAHGNARWVDCTPDLVAVVRAPDGSVVMASNASAWHLTACGYGEHLPAEATS